MIRILLFTLLYLISLGTHAEIQTEEVVYQIDGDKFSGYLAYDSAISGKRPGILVLHEWWGHNDYARKRADMLAELGYTAFALDMYGEGKVADHPDDAKKFMQAVVNSPSATEKRFTAAHEILLKHSTTDKTKTAAVGYCMGGGIALHMARAGKDLNGVVSFHGSLGTKTPAEAGRVKAKILVLTGAADPFIPEEQVRAFKEEMEAAGVDYELISYPDVKHSFTNPQADSVGEKFDMPLAYDAAADKDSWERMKLFLKDIF